MSVKALRQRAVSAYSALRSLGRVVCVYRRLTLCIVFVQTENIQGMPRIFLRGILSWRYLWTSCKNAQRPF